MVAKMQQDLTSQPLSPADLNVCSRWLQERKSLLHAERCAWQVLPSTLDQASRIEVNVHMF